MFVLPEGRFFDQETDDENDYPYLEPLAGIPGLPPVSVDHTEAARFQEALDTGVPLAEACGEGGVR